MRDTAAILAGIGAETLIAGLEGPDESGFGSLPDRPAPWWSFTKTVLAAAALALVRDGRLNLDNMQGSPFSLRQLLQHTAGLPDYGGLEDYKTAVAHHDEPWTVEQMLDRANAATLLFLPGRGWSYSNIGYLLVGRILEEATGESLADALRHLVFDPLDLEGVGLAQVRTDLDDTAWGNARRYHPGWVYHGLLVGSPRAAARLLHRLFLRDFLPHDLRRAMLDLHAVGEPIPGRPFRQPGYGLGVMGDSGRPQGPIIGHTGQGPGSTCAVYHASSGSRVRTVAVFRPADGPDAQGPLEELAFELLESPLSLAGLEAP